MRNTIRYVGLDVHKDTIVIAVADEGRDAPEVLGTIPNTWAALQKKLKRLGPKANLRCCYEAGPTGYGIYRDLKAAGISCIVVAPSLVPEKKGTRREDFAPQSALQHRKRRKPKCGSPQRMKASRRSLILGCKGP